MTDKYEKMLQIKLLQKKNKEKSKGTIVKVNLDKICKENEKEAIALIEQEFAYRAQKNAKANN